MLAIFWSASANALLIDSFDDSINLIATTASGNLAFGNTLDSANMIGERAMQVSSFTESIIENTTIAQVSGGLLGLTNGPATKGTVLLRYLIATTDLTEGGSNDGFFLSLPGRSTTPLICTFLWAELRELKSI